MLIFGLLVLWETSQIRAGVYRDSIGSKAFPYAMGILITSLSAILCIRRLKAMNSKISYCIPHEGTPDESGVPASAWRAFSIMGVTGVYIAALIPMGYLLATPLFVVGSLYVMKEQRLIRISIIAIIWTIVTYIVFAQFLFVRLPLGPLESIFMTIGLI